MSVGVFSDKKHQPSEAEIHDAIGSKFSIWRDLIQFIRGKYAVEEDFRFLYGKNYGWGWRFRVKGQLLTSLYPRKEGFAAQVNLSPAAIERAKQMKLGRNVQQAIAAAHPYPEGRWLFIIVETRDDLKDIQQLLALRAEARSLNKES
ncbi:MAG TPA: DUF3788 family protein [Anaerolineales bacterium]|nr:DUF3788 family protein [Anaerolineales bacterium]